MNVLDNTNEINFYDLYRSGTTKLVGVYAWGCQDTRSDSDVRLTWIWKFIACLSQ